MLCVYTQIAIQTSIIWLCYTWQTLNHKKRDINAVYDDKLDISRNSNVMVCNNSFRPLYDRASSIHQFVTILWLLSLFRNHWKNVKEHHLVKVMLQWIIWIVSLSMIIMYDRYYNPFSVANINTYQLIYPDYEYTCAWIKITITVY